MPAQHANGTFEVKITPLPAYTQSDDPTIARMAIEKQFHVDLEAVSKGEMISAGSPQKGSAGYVAMEKVTGTLNGKKGSFVLQHSATMHRGNQQLSVAVVPGSGSGELVGLTGQMNIKIAGGKHFYEFEYSFEEAQ